jgi:5'-deoxynucleotidase YfbR-like HD superfamily hydrolase
MKPTLTLIIISFRWVQRTHENTMANPALPYSLETVTGKFVDLVDPDPADICIEDIAWSLSRLARFNGHTIQALPYSVAQHSIVVAYEAMRLLKEESPSMSEIGLARIARLALLHDASEAYTGDVSGPLKKVPEFRPIIKKLEHVIQEAIYEALGLMHPSPEEERIIKYSDLIAQRIEAYNFMVSRGQNWSNMPEVSIVKLQEFEPPVPSIQAYQQFLDTYNLQF